MKIGDKERPIYGNINGLIELKEKYGLDLLNGVDTKSFDLASIRSLVFVALVQGAKHEKQEIDFTIEDVGDWLTPKNMGELLPEAMNAFFGGVELKQTDKPGE